MTKNETFINKTCFVFINLMSLLVYYTRSDLKIFVRVLGDTKRVD